MGDIMKRQIFWLIFSCLTATFLSHSMEEIGSFKEIDEKINRMTIDRMLIEGEAVSFLELYPYIAKQNEENFDLPQYHLNLAKDNYETNKQNNLAQTLAKQKIINEDHLKGFVFNQLINILNQIVKKNYNLRSFSINALDEFYQTVIDKKNLKKFLLDLPSNYLPNMLNDIRINLIAILLIEEMTEYIKDIPNSTDHEGNNLWLNLKKYAFLQFFLNRYL